MSCYNTAYLGSIVIDQYLLNVSDAYNHSRATERDRKRGTILSYPFFKTDSYERFILFLQTHLYPEILWEH